MSKQHKKQAIFSENLRYIMEYKKITQNQLAVAMSVNQSSVSDWVKGQSLPQKKRVAKLCEVLQVKENELFGDIRSIDGVEILEEDWNDLEPLSVDDYLTLLRPRLSMVNDAGRHCVLEYADMIANNKKYKNADVEKQG